MSELIHAQNGTNGLRRLFLTTVSALALFAVASPAEAAANDADNPLVWVELGGQFDAVNDGHDAFTPPYLLTPRPSFETGSPESLQHGPHLGWDADIKLTLQPAESDLVLSASVRYGRSLRSRKEHNQPPPIAISAYSGYAFGPFAFYEGTARTLDTHMIADFRAGRDVGLGMFGLRGSSVLSLGVRYANFDSTSDTQLSSQPTILPTAAHLFHATAHIHRSFAGVGPSISWDASTPFVGNPENGSLWLDWGANAAILFGKQNVGGSHETREQARVTSGAIYSHHPLIARSHGRNVPNVGGFAAFSYRLQDVKLSVGYRADLFFGAIDGGVDVAKSYDRGFYGPFASISIGIGG